MNFLIFGLIAPIGSNKKIFVDFLNEKKDRFNFEIAETINFSQDYLAQFIDSKIEKKRFTQLINIGNEIREISNNNGILVIKAATLIIQTLLATNQTNNKTQVFIISSLKHSDEVDLLKNTFGKNLLLIGLNSSEEKRKMNMINDEENIRELFERDKNEELSNGQQLDKIFKKSDFFISIDDKSLFHKKMERFLNLLNGHPFCTPEKDELFMFNAYTASTRSASVNRQVGAVIVSQANEILSTGCNEAPKYGGGHYWPGDEEDAR